MAKGIPPNSGLSDLLRSGRRRQAVLPAQEVDPHVAGAHDGHLVMIIMIIVIVVIIIVTIPQLILTRRPADPMVPEDGPPAALGRHGRQG